MFVDSRVHTSLTTHTHTHIFFLFPFVCSDVVSQRTASLVECRFGFFDPFGSGVGAAGQAQMRLSAASHSPSSGSIPALSALRAKALAFHPAVLAEADAGAWLAVGKLQRLKGPGL